MTELYQTFKEEVADELADLAERQGYCEEGQGARYRWRWSQEKLIQDVGFISSMNLRVSNKGYDPDWPVTVKNLVVILRQEQSIQDRIEDEERDRELERQLGGGRSANR